MPHSARSRSQPPELRPRGHIDGLHAALTFYPQLQSDAPSSETSWWVVYLPHVFAIVVGGPVMAKLVAVLTRLIRFPMGNLEKFVEKPNYKEKIGFLERFHEDFERCVETYIPGRRTFVFIDDLDRCEVPKAVELLHALNLMLAKGLPFVVVLAMDRPKIAAGVATRHKELLRFLPGPPSTEGTDALNERARGIAHGYEFVEKFVQLSIRIPRLGPGALPDFLRNLVSPATAHPAASEVRPRGEVEDPVATDGEEVQRVLELVAPVLGYNPRRLKQFLNLFRFRYFVARKTEHAPPQSDQWTLPQLGKLVAIELHWPTLLDALLAQPDAVAELCAAAAGTPMKCHQRPSSDPDPPDPPVTSDPAGGAAAEYAIADVERRAQDCLCTFGADRDRHCPVEGWSG